MTGVEEFADGGAAGLVGLGERLALVGIHGVAGAGVIGLRGAALRAAVRKPGLVRLQLELFFTNDTDFDGEGHAAMIRRGNAEGKRVGSGSNAEKLGKIEVCRGFPLAGIARRKDTIQGTLRFRSG